MRPDRAAHLRVGNDGLVCYSICQLPPSLCAMALPCEHGLLRPAAGEGLTPFGEEQGIWQLSSILF